MDSDAHPGWDPWIGSVGASGVPGVRRTPIYCADNPSETDSHDSNSGSSYGTDPDGYILIAVSN